MKIKQVLVTGADGFIGSHLTEALARRGCSVRALVQYNSFNSWGWLDHSPRDLLASIEIVSGDVRDAAQMRKLSQGCDTILHLAALIAIPYSYNAPESYVATNVSGTLNILQAARDLGVEKVIQTSTSEVYGSARFVPITEDHPLNAQSPYAATKIAADQLALSFQQSFGTPVCVVRPFNTYGPRQSARAVIPTVITQILAGSSRIKLGALHPTRDFNYVPDIVRGFVAAAESDASIGRVINLGSNFEISIGATATSIAEAMGRPDIEIEQDAQRLRPADSEVDRLWSSNDLARELLGWQPEYHGIDGFKRGIKETVAWFADESNRQFFKPQRYNT